MGVDHFNCCICGRIFNDYGMYYTCAEFGHMFCEDCGKPALKKYGENEYGELNSCPLCSKEIIADVDVLEYVLQLAGTTREEVEAWIRAGK